MKKIANVKEISNKADDMSIVYAIGSSEDVCKPKILAYLKSGDITGKASENFVDVITMKEINAVPFFFSDGEYEWSAEEIYYVERYNLTLDKEFLLKLGIDGKEKYRRRKLYSN
ncbi:MAG: hypothetical protein IKA95_00020 [Clostridia bacterium]|nr:hypothetical protein [Clostridia bacterium]